MSENLRDRYAEAMREHYIDLTYRGPDNDSRCICLGWVDGDDWDDHLADAVLAVRDDVLAEKDAEVERLRRNTAGLYERAHAAEAKVARVEAVHPERVPGFCAVDDYGYPCATLRALADEPTGEDEPATEAPRTRDGEQGGER